MAIAGFFYSTLSLGSIFYQIGATPIWVPLVIILLVILLFWWGLTRNRIGETEDDSVEEVDQTYDMPTQANTLDDQHAEAESDEHIDEEAQPAAVVSPDDLKVIEGIGPKISSILADAGIVTFSQLAETDVATLEQIVVKQGGISLARPGTWPEQAKLAAAGQWDELQKLQDDLHGGIEKD